MGLIVHPLDEDLAKQLGYEPTTRGLLVLKMDRECPLSGNLQLYDVLEQVGRSPVRSLEDLTRALEENDEMESLVLKIQRDPQASTTAQLVIWQRDR